MHLAKHAWILSISVSNNDNFCQSAATAFIEGIGTSNIAGGLALLQHLVNKGVRLE